MNLLLLQYNNYFNRKVLKEETIDGYLSHSTKHLYYPGDVAFNPNEGVNAKQVINWEEDWNPDYLVCINENNEIVQRWFIVEATRTRLGQYELKLKRDTVSDYLEIVKNSPILLEKGTIKDYNDKFIYNSENFQCNEIKTNEILLWDNTKVPWLVLYLAKGTLGGADSGSFSTSYTADYSYEEVDDFPIFRDYGDDKNTPYKSWTNLNFRTFASDGDFDLTGIRYIFNCQINSNNNTYGTSETDTPLVLLTNLKFYYGKPVSLITSQLFTKYLLNFDTLINKVKTYYGYNSKNDLQNLLSYEGKILYTSSDARYYRIHINQISNGSETVDVTDTQSELKEYMQNFFNEVSGLNYTQYANNRAFKILSQYSRYEVELEDVTSLASINWSLSTVSGQTDSPLDDVVCMPYGTITYDYTNPFTLNKEFSLAAFNSITKVLTSSKVYDYQIIPYCPIPGMVVMDDDVPSIDIPDATHRIVFEDSNNDEVGCAIVVPSIKIDDVNIYVPINKPERFGDYNDVYNTKLLNDCYKYRICSPNYNGLFEFNLAKNNSECPFFNLDMTLKPQMPYIHLNPNFEGLYGRDYNDARGLICGGDFSIGIINSAWQQYEIQNKNYQNLFDRQIQNMDTKFAIQQLNTSLVGLGSATVGLMNPNPVGTIAGAAGAVGSVGRLVTNALSYEEERDYAKDVHEFNLKNIQALPYSITKSTPLTNNNKLVPFVEVYECSDEEKQAYMDMLTYDGMTLNKITKISEYTGGFIRGKLIRLEGINDDSHINFDIYKEISKGVYMYE